MAGRAAWTAPPAQLGAAGALPAAGGTVLLVGGLSLVMLQTSATTVVGAALALPVAAAFAVSHGRVLRGRLPLTLLAFFAWTVSSAAWSQDPRSTLRTVAGTALLLALGTLMAWGRTTSHVARLVLAGATAVSAVAIGLAVARPAVALSEGNLRGLAPHENQLGFIAVVGVVSLAVCVVERLVRWPAACAAGVLCGGALLWSGSKTGLLVAAVTVVSFLVLRAVAGLPRRWQGPLVLLTLAGAGGAALVAALNRGVVAEALGRDVTLTGRTEIWHVVWLLAREELLKGYGAGAVWRPSSAVGGTVERTVHYFPSHAHNGYLDALLQVGAVGLGLVVLLLLLALARGSRQLLLGRSGWPVAMAVLLVLYNLSETRFLDHTGWLLLVLVCTPAAGWETDGAPGSGAWGGHPLANETNRKEDLRWRFRIT